MKDLPAPKGRRNEILRFADLARNDLGSDPRGVHG